MREGGHGLSMASGAVDKPAESVISLGGVICKGIHMRPEFLTIAPNGRLLIPAEMRAELGVQRGGRVVARVENGAVILEAVAAAVRRAQSMIREYDHGGGSAVQELIQERRAAAGND